MSWRRFFERYGVSATRKGIDRLVKRGWPSCPTCHQSMTASYGKKPVCLRCSSDKRLVGHTD